MYLCHQQKRQGPIPNDCQRKSKHNREFLLDLNDDDDRSEAIDLVITHISHQKLDTSFQNLVQIDAVIKDKEMKDLLVPHIDNLLNACALKLNVALEHLHYLNSDYQTEEVFRLFKGLFSFILDVSSFTVLPDTASGWVQNPVANFSRDQKLATGFWNWTRPYK